MYGGITFSLNMHAMYLKDGNNLEGPVTWRLHFVNKGRNWKTDKYLSIGSVFFNEMTSAWRTYP